MAITSIADMQIVPHKFSEYTIERTTQKSMLVNGGITTGNATVAQLINGTPKGGSIIEMPFFKALSGVDRVFGETALTNPDKVETGLQKATLLIRQNFWGDTDLSYVYGGADPMTAIGNLVGDWWVEREQAVILSILKGILDPTAGALKDHVNDLRSATDKKISVNAALDTKQKLGDHAGSLGSVFMHSATHTQLQKNQDIATEYDATLQIQIQTYLGYRVVVDDGMPYYTYEVSTADTGTTAVTTSNIDQIQPFCKDTLVAGTSKVKALDKPYYETYFLGAGALIREYGTPQGLITTEVDRDKLAAENYLINRRAYIMHPNGLSWVASALTDTSAKYAANVDLAKPSNWSLVVDHKKVPIASLIHTLS